MILLIDNYDSFTFNLVQALRAPAPPADNASTHAPGGPPGALASARGDASGNTSGSGRLGGQAGGSAEGWTSTSGAAQEVRVVRNDALDVDALLALLPAAVVLSPGPGRPADAGVCPELLRRLPDDVPLFGVCLGHQALVERYGGTVEQDPVPVHGRESAVFHDGSALFAALPNPFAAGRYHSLRARRADLPGELAVTAWTEDGVVMGVRHRELPRHGVQFHPESILSPDGPRLIAAFLALVRGRAVQ